MRISSRSLATTSAALVLLCASTASLAQSNNISANYLTGVWKENAQCQGNEAMVFFPNGTMSSAGSVPVNYTVSGPSQITMFGAGGAAQFNVQSVNQNQMILTVQNSSTVVYRCASNFGAQPANPPQLTVAFITGGWGFNGNCASPDVFNANGRLRSALGTDASWAIFGGTLRLTNPNGASTDFSVQINNNSNMLLVNQANGQVSNYTRCF